MMVLDDDRSMAVSDVAVARSAVSMVTAVPVELDDAFLYENCSVTPVVEL